MGASKTSTLKKPSAVVVAAAEKRRQYWPWSQLPPTTPLIYPPSLKSQMWSTNNSPPAIIKSRPPATTCCNNAHLRLHLHHLTTAVNASSPTAEFLNDSTIDAQTMYESKNASYWCVLRVDSTPRTIHPPPPPLPISYTDRLNLLGPYWMAISGLEGPNVPNSGLVVNYGVSRKTSIYTSTGKNVSIRHECAVIDPFDLKKKPIEFTTNIIRYQGKYYAMSLQGTLVVMQMSNHLLKITSMSAIRAIPSSHSRFFKEYLVEMDGEILLIFLIYEKSLEVVDRVEVFRLDFVKLGWIKVESLEGKTMFLKEKCIWVNSAELGCMDDCVYFAQGSDDFWRVFDLKNGCF